MKEIKIAVCGNPNTGKSTLINAIAGAKLQVGNWPGVTVEKKEVTLKEGDYLLHFIDLPGAYSLRPFSLEEKITRDFLFTEKPEVILCVVDSTNLERNLFFLIQLAELGVPVVCALNIFDEAEKLGYKINVPLLEELLQIKAVPTVATKGKGIDDLKKKIVEAYEENLVPKEFSYGEDFERFFSKVGELLREWNPELKGKFIPKALIIKILEEDKELLEKMGLKIDDQKIKEIVNYIEKLYGIEFESLLIEKRYGFAHGITKEVLKEPETRRITLTERFDRVFLDRILGIPIFLIIMWFLFKVSFDFSSPYVDFLDETFNGPIKKWVATALEALSAPEWVSSIILDGIIAGVGTVLTFVPLIGIIMLLITFLEGSGYMARAAFLMDRIMKTFGVHGKSFIPMLMGFGCNVPSVYATRIIESERERKLTLFLIPFMSCGARLPVYVVFISVFFASASGTILFFLYVLGIVVAMLVGIVIHKAFYKGKSSPFIMELPPYRIPTLRDLSLHTWTKLRHFVIKAGTWILLINLLVWCLLNLPWKPEKPEDSLLGKVGKTIAPVFKPLGFGDWASASSLLAGVLAKEVVVSTMAQIYGGEEEKKDEGGADFWEDLKGIGLNFIEKTKEAFLNVFSGFAIVSLSPEVKEEGKGLISKLSTHFSPASALSFMIFVLLYWPCFVYGMATKAELGSFRLYLQAILLHTLVAYLVAFIIYQIGRLFL